MQNTLTKIGDVAAKYGITHRALHYWENAGILKSMRTDNDYRYYDEENLLKIKQIILLRKLRLSIPSIQEIFVSNELSKAIAVFTAHIKDTQNETKQLTALGKVLSHLLNMLKDRQNIDSVYSYLDANYGTESEELKLALQTVLAQPVQEDKPAVLPEPVIDMTGVDLTLERANDFNEIESIIKECYANVQADNLLQHWDTRGFDYQNCRWFYKIMQNGRCVGAVQLAYVGMEAMLIRNLAYSDPDNNIYLFELLKREFPDILCWMIRNAADIGDFNYDYEDKKQQFWEDNGFVFYTSARYNQFIKMLKPHDEVYNSSRYRFALLDGSMHGVSFRFFGLEDMDFYDGKMTNWRITDCNFSNALLYDSWMGGSKFYDTGFYDSEFKHCDLSNVRIENCCIDGMTIDGVNVAEAIKVYKAPENVKIKHNTGGNQMRKIEDIIKGVLKGHMQKNALDLIAHIRASEEDGIFSISAYDETNTSEWSGFNITDLGYIIVNGSGDFPGPWTMWIGADNLGEHSQAGEHIKEFAWAHVSPCGSCGGKCSPGTRTRIFGRDFENVCQNNLIFINPDADAVVCIKKIIDIRKNDIVKKTV